MPIELLSALMTFALVSTITPGPNNMMLLASGANFGLWRTLPHMLGVASGFFLMMILVGIGIMQLFDALPASYQLLQVISVGYMLYLAFKIATATQTAEPGKQASKPISYLQAALFQWINPKAWTMAVTAISVYAPERDLRSVLLVTMVFSLINVPSISSWAVLGLKMQKLLSNRARMKAFNRIMAGLLVLSLYPVLA